MVDISIAYIPASIGSLLTPLAYRLVFGGKWKGGSADMFGFLLALVISGAVGILIAAIETLALPGISTEAILILLPIDLILSGIVGGYVWVKVFLKS